ncbi:MAG: hypothetical protein IKX93_09975 [Bacteroidaceae bacterium]|nr:hypothetical protein [Bacteroidaceae bacterium]
MIQSKASKVNRSFMWGVAFMAVAVFGVVFIFMNMCLERMAVKQYQESYGIELQSGFVGDSIKVYVNDSLLYNKVVQRDSVKIPIRRFEDNSMLMVVDARTDLTGSFNLSKQSENVIVKRDADKKFSFESKERNSQ